MSRPTRLAAVLALVVAACTSVPASPSPTAPTLPSPSATATAGTTPTSACPIAERSGALPSDRLENAEVTTEGSLDRVTFSFGERSTAPLDPRGTLREGRPPFFQGGSGEEVAVTGERFVELRFEGVLIGDEAGNSVYQGATDLSPNLPALKQLVVTEQFEGIISFVAGFDGPGCVELGGNPGARTVTLEIAH